MVVCGVVIRFCVNKFVVVVVFVVLVKNVVIKIIIDFLGSLKIFIIGLKIFFKILIKLVNCKNCIII